MSVFLELTLSKEESDFETACLDGGVSLAAAAARGTTHLAVTGSETAVSVFLTEHPQVVRIPISETEFEEKGTEVKMSDSMRLIASVDRLAASVSGVVTSSLAGQGSVFLEEFMVHSGKNPPRQSFPIQFSNWKNISAVISVHDARVVTQSGQRFTVRFAQNDQVEQDEASASEELQKLYDESWSVRQQVQYDAAPTLTKSVMHVPVGIGGSGYDASISAVAKPPAQTADALEDLLKATISSELGQNPEHFEAFLGVEGIEASKWSGVVMSAFSTAAAWLIPYKGDSASILLPRNVLQEHSTESWLAEPTRLGMADDCDGSAAWITSSVYQIESIFRDNPRADYPTLRAVWRALAFHKVGIAVLSAHAGNAADAKGAGGTIAGHAQTLAIPKIHLVDALGGDETIQAARRDLYFGGMELRIPSSDHRKLLSGQLDDAMRALPALAGEGTGAASSTLWEPDPERREKIVASEKTIDRAFQLLSPSQGIGLRDLHTGKDGTHKFYSHFVEVLFDWQDLKSQVLQKHGQAAAHLVVGHGNKAGVTPQEMATGQYTAVPLWTADMKRASIMLASKERVRKNTLPRGDPVKLSAAQEANLVRADSNSSVSCALLTFGFRRSRAWVLLQSSTRTFPRQAFQLPAPRTMTKYAWSCPSTV